MYWLMPSIAWKNIYNMLYQPELVQGRLIKRYKRFLADVQLPNGEIITVHTANTGKMTGCAIPGSKIWIRNTFNEKRKYPYTWEISSTADGELVGINTQLANSLSKEAIENGVIKELQGYDQIRTEVAYGKEINGKKRSRIDLLLSAREQASQKDCYVEVKNVTACFEGHMGAFPDAVSKRGTKHLNELLYMHQQGYRSVLLFCVARADIHAVRGAHEIDPEYAETLVEVTQKGVEVLAYATQISTTEIYLANPLSVVLD